MGKADQEMNEYGKRVLRPLQDIESIDPDKAKELKAAYLLRVETLRSERASQGARAPSTHLAARQPRAWIKVLTGALLALVMVIFGSVTVYAAQNSLPGEPLYALKTWVEDFQISMASSPQAKLDLTLKYTDRRVSEISTLIKGGKSLPDVTSQRFGGELETALLLAAEMDDSQMQKALGKIKRSAESQGMTIEELIEKLPVAAAPAINKLQQRLQEQVHLSNFGEQDPQGFRLQIHEREDQRYNHGKKSTPAAETTITPASPADATQAAGENEQDNGNGRPSGGPAQDEDKNGQGNKNENNGNHGPNKTLIP